MWSFMDQLLIGEASRLVISVDHFAVGASLSAADSLLLPTNERSTLLGTVSTRESFVGYYCAVRLTWSADTLERIEIGSHALSAHTP